MTVRGAGHGSTFEVGGPDVVWREADDEIVVLDLDGSVYFSLNGPAGELWRRLAVGARLADLTAVLMAGAEVGEEQARADAGAFLDELRRFGLLRERRSPA